MSEKNKDEIFNSIDRINKVGIIYDITNIFSSIIEYIKNKFKQ
jgi:hypothetical protein